jgi:hypothetical protein
VQDSAPRSWYGSGPSGVVTDPVVSEILFTRESFFPALSPTFTSSNLHSSSVPLSPKKWPTQRKAKAQKTSPVCIHLYDSVQDWIFTRLCPADFMMGGVSAVRLPG